MKAPLLGPIETAAALGAFVIVAMSAGALQLLALWSGPPAVTAAGWSWLASVVLACLLSGGIALALRRYFQRVRGMATVVTLRQVPKGLPFSVDPDPSGKVYRAVIQLRQRWAQTLDARRSVREQAEETERYETEFLKSLSHELRTPLNAIVGFTQVVLEEIDGPIDASQREDLETILAAGLHLTDLVDDVLDLAAMQSARFHLEQRAVDVKPILASVASLLEGQRGASDVRVELALPEEPVIVMGDPKRLRQVFTNLASNAMKFTEVGFVRLSAALTDEEAILSIDDSGPGIRSDDLAVIFEEFSQVGDVRRKGQGSGLGLAICRRLVALHGGRITVESVVGQGSSFRVHLKRESST